MATPLAAQYRINFQITVDRLVHKLRTYLRVIPGSGASGFDVVMRDGTTGIDTNTIADSLLNLIASSFQASVTTFDNPTLEQLSGSAWLPIAPLTITVAPTGTAAYSPASQFSLTLRDSAFHKIRFILLETEDLPGQKFFPPGSGGAVAFFSYFTTTPGAGSTHGHNWMRGRSDLYVSSAVAIVTDLNDRLRRDRGIA